MPFVAPQSTAGIAGIDPVSASSSSIGSSSTSTPAPTLDTSLPLRTSLLLAVVTFTPLLVVWLVSLYSTKAQGASIPACLPKKIRSVHRTAQRPGRCSIAPKRWLIWALFLAAALVVCAVPNQLSDQGVDINRNHVNDSGADLSTGETKTRSDLNDNGKLSWLLFAMCTLVEYMLRKVLKKTYTHIAICISDSFPLS